MTAVDIQPACDTNVPRVGLTKEDLMLMLIECPVGADVDIACMEFHEDGTSRVRLLWSNSPDRENEEW